MAEAGIVKLLKCLLDLVCSLVQFRCPHLEEPFHSKAKRDPCVIGDVLLLVNNRGPETARDRVGEHLDFILNQCKGFFIGVRELDDREMLVIMLLRIAEAGTGGPYYSMGSEVDQSRRSGAISSL